MAGCRTCKISFIKNHITGCTRKKKNENKRKRKTTFSLKPSFLNFTIKIKFLQPLLSSLSSLSSLKLSSKIFIILSSRHMYRIQLDLSHCILYYILLYDGIPLPGNIVEKIFTITNSGNKDIELVMSIPIVYEVSFKQILFLRLIY